MRFFSYFFDIVFPKKCYICSCPGKYICFDCQRNIKYSNDSKNNIVLYHYKPIKKLIHDAKFYGKKDILREIWVSMGEALLQKNVTIKNSLIIPVPLHFLKKLKRGYNQTEILAQQISLITGIPYTNNLVERKKQSRQQSHSSRHMRQQNIKNCFYVHQNQTDNIDKKHIILVDDVISTGSTLHEVKKQLVLNYPNITITTLCIASD